MEKTANIRRVLTHRCSALGIPVSGNFELTPRCNLQCKMCYIRMTPDQMQPIGRERTAQEWLSLAQEARDAGMTFLLITGGEPTLRSDFPQIYEGLNKLGLSISINTNGTLLTPEIRQLWHRLPPAQVNITLYGTCREDYSNLCNNPEAFDRVVEGLDWLKSEGILVHLNTTMAPSNIHRWTEIEDFAMQRGLELRMTAYCFPPVRRDNCSSCAEFERLLPEQAGAMIVQDFLYREGADAIRRRASNLDTPIQNSCELDNGESMQCTAGRSQFWVTWDGRMTPCGMMNCPAVYPFDSGFIQAWNMLKSEIEPIRLSPDCATCEIRSTCINCAATAYAETGRFDRKPEYLCRLNQAYRDKLKMISASVTF